MVVFLGAVKHLGLVYGDTTSFADLVGALVEEVDLAVVADYG